MTTKCSLLLLAALSSCSIFRPEMAPSPTPRDGGVTVGIAAAGALDPAVASESALLVLKTACDGLLSVDHSTPAPKPALASGWQMAADAKSLRITLRKGMRFHDGSSVDARSIAANISRIARPATQSPWSKFLAPVAGFAEVASGGSAELVGLSVISEVVLEIALSAPFADFPSLLSHPGFIPLAVAELSKEPDQPVAPACAGPYRVESAEGSGSIRLIRDESYEGNNRGFLPVKGPDEIVFRLFENNNDAFEAQRRGELDASPVPDSRALEVPAAEILRRTTREVTMLAFDPARTETSSSKLRQAISLAIDRRAIIDAGYGDGRVALVRWLGAEAEALDSPCADFARQRTSDPERARALFSESGAPADFKLPLNYDSSSIGRLVAQSIGVQVQDTIGVQLEPRPMDPPVFAESLRARSEAAIWIVTAPSPVPVSRLAFESLFTAGGNNNVFGFANQKVEDLVARGRRETDESERNVLYEDAESAVCNQLPYLPMWSGVRHWAADPKKVEFAEDKTVDAFGDLLLRHARSLASSGT